MTLAHIIPRQKSDSNLNLTGARKGLFRPTDQVITFLLDVIIIRRDYVLGDAASFGARFSVHALA